MWYTRGPAIVGAARRPRGCTQRGPARRPRASHVVRPPSPWEALCQHRPQQHAGLGALMLGSGCHILPTAAHTFHLSQAREPEAQSRPGVFPKTHSSGTGFGPARAHPESPHFWESYRDVRVHLSCVPAKRPCLGVRTCGVCQGIARDSKPAVCIGQKRPLVTEGSLGLWPPAVLACGKMGCRPVGLPGSWLCGTL